MLLFLTATYFFKIFDFNNFNGPQHDSEIFNSSLFVSRLYGTSSFQQVSFGVFLKSSLSNLRVSFFQLQGIIQSFPAFSSLFIILFRISINPDDFYWTQLLAVRIWALENFADFQKSFLDFVAFLLFVCHLLLL
jgi:hypothetical protein